MPIGILISKDMRNFGKWSGLPRPPPHHQLQICKTAAHCPSNPSVSAGPGTQSRAAPRRNHLGAPPVLLWLRLHGGRLGKPRLDWRCPSNRGDAVVNRSRSGHGNIEKLESYCAKRGPCARFFSQRDAWLACPLGPDGAPSMGGWLLNRNCLVIHRTGCLVSVGYYPLTSEPLRCRGFQQAA